MARTLSVVLTGMGAGAPWFLIDPDRLVFQILGLVCGMVGGLVGGLGYDWYTERRALDRGARYF